MMGGFLAFFGPKLLLSSFIHLDMIFSLNKAVYSIQSKFFFYFPLFFFFFVFLSSTSCGMWLCYRTTVESFAGFRVDNSDNKIVSIKHISHIKSMFVGMLH